MKSELFHVKHELAYGDIDVRGGIRITDHKKSVSRETRFRGATALITVIRTTALSFT
jgi:hypothetical protein